jgi:hypothetical protein
MTEREGLVDAIQVRPCFCCSVSWKHHKSRKPLDMSLVMVEGVLEGGICVTVLIDRPIHMLIVP